MNVDELRIDRVFIIQSLEPGELKTGSNLKAFVQSSLGVPVDLTDVDTEGQFFDRLKEIEDAATSGDGFLLVIECHGAKEGLHLNEAFVEWPKVKEGILPINRKSAMGLVVFFASCHGINFFRQVSIKDICPFYRMAGPNDEIYASQLETANKSILEGLSKGLSLDEALVSANAPLLVHDLEYIRLKAEQSYKDAFIKYLKECCAPISMIGRMVQHGKEFDKIVAGGRKSKMEAEGLYVKNVLDKKNLEDSYYQYHDRFLHTGEHPELHARFQLIFDDIYSESGISSYYPGI